MGRSRKEQTRSLKACKAVIICHGKSEYQLASWIKTNLRLNIDVHGNDKGRSSIQIQGLFKYLNKTRPFCNKNNLLRTISKV